MSNTVLVTGGGGFIGSWVLRELLSRGLSSIAYDKQLNAARWKSILGDDAAKVQFVAGSLLDRALLSRVVTEHQEAPLADLTCTRHPEGGGLVLGLLLVTMQVDPGFRAGRSDGAGPVVR